MTRYFFLQIEKPSFQPIEYWASFAMRSASLRPKRVPFADSHPSMYPSRTAGGYPVRLYVGRAACARRESPSSAVSDLVDGGTAAGRVGARTVAQPETIANTRIKGSRRMASLSNFTLDRVGRAGLLAGLLSASACAWSDAALRTTELRIGKHALRVEVAESDPQREKGLMFREKLGRNDGMLFIFDDPGYHAMWMMNTYIPLSVAFVDKDGVILNIEDMQPRTLDGHQAAGPAVYAIETNKGWFAERHITPGQKVSGLPKAARAR